MALGWRLPVAALAVVGQSVIGYVTENGKLPEWMPEKLSWLGKLLSAELHFSLWVLILVVVGVGIAGWWFLKRQSLEAKECDERLKLIKNELAIYKEKVSALTENNVELTRQLDARNAQEIESTDRKPLFDIKSIEFRTIAAIAVGINRGMPVTLAYLTNALRASNIEVLAALDTLSLSEFVSSSITGKGRIYKLTAKGRAFIVSEV